MSSGMSRWRRWDAPRFLVLAATATALSAAALLASWLPGGTPFCGPGCIDRRLTALTASDGALPLARVGEAKVLVRRQLAFSPFDASGWLRLSAIQAIEGGGRLTPAAVQSLERSYAFTPVDLRVARWRLRFAFDHWAELPPRLRDSAVAELRSLLPDRKNYDALQGLDREIQSPAGRLAYRLLFAQSPRP
jgi:hypothetical protein